MNIHIVDFIPYGKANAVTTAELKVRTGLDVRTIRQLIANERLKGAVICSSLRSEGGGYFLPESPKEAVEYVNTEKLRIGNYIRAVQGAIDYVSGGGDEY